MSEKPIEFMDSTYWLQTLVQCAKECVGVFMFLVAYSRMELFDTFTGPLVLYMVLVVLAFPFINSYLFLLMRWGPWYNRKQGVRTAWFFTAWFLRTLLQFLLVTGFHALGAYTASLAVKQYRDDARWENAALVQTVYSGGRKWKNFAEHPEDRQSTVVAPELSYRSAEYKDSHEVRAIFLFEEFFAVFILLVGMLHLIEAVTPKLLMNAFWQKDAQGEDFVLSNGAGFSSRHRDLSIMVQRILSEVQKLGKLSRSKTGSGDTGDSGEQEHPTLTAYVPVPFMLIFQMCILVAGVSRAFPSAHLSMHVSIYNGLMGTASEVVMLRIAGGNLAGWAAVLYYYVWYVYVGKPDGVKLGAFTGMLHDILLEPGPVLLQSEMFRIPARMAVTVNEHMH